ncbi:MAG: hypothetical protein QOD74_73 [Variibacter sp.]|jgi:invasion protein IalB|nr:hypothetical protein [Variibacter sp.]
MGFRKLTALARPARMTLGTVAALAGLTCLSVAALAQAQQQQQPPRQPAPRPQQQPQRPAQQPPAQPQQPAQQQQPPADAQQAGVPPAAETPPLIYSPWTKVCGKDGQTQQAAASGKEAPGKEVCFTIKEARLDTGQFVASAGVIELDGEAKKILRVTLPLGLLLRHGTRMLVDGQQPATGMYNFCLPNGCWADFEVDKDFVGRMKKAQSLVLQAFNLNGQVASFPFPLTDFAKASDGPPTDPKVLEEQQKKLQDELQRRAEDARKRLEQQGGAPKQ